jgi:AraC-like DNA-binding protein
LKGVFRYGRTTYDFGEGSLVFTAPDQVISPDIDSLIIEGWGIYIHPDFLNANPRGHALTQLPFWGYDTHEALHISEAEKDILEDCVEHVQREIALNLDQHSYNLILRNLELFFDYCVRFYDRQFLTRAGVSRDIVQRFERLLADYFAQETLVEAGLPDVKYFASRLNLSPNYLSDVLNKYTGKTTQEHIHLKLVDKAKALLWGTEKAVSEIAYELGFEHPSHFTKLFKNKTGVSPREFRGRG